LLRRTSLELCIVHWHHADNRGDATTSAVFDFVDADVIFSTLNNSKVVAINRIESRELQPGPMMLRARKLYWDWAHSGAIGAWMGGPAAVPFDL